MGKTAARKGDTLAVKASPPSLHTFTLTNGATGTSPCDHRAPVSVAVSANVSIGGQPAALQSGQNESGSHPVLDVMPGVASWSPVLKGGASVTAGSQTVFINGKPAVRIGDAATCCQFSGAVTAGAAGGANVFIGD